MKKTWSGRFKKPLNPEADAFNASVWFDKRLFKHDVEAGLAHAKALLKAKVLTRSEYSKIVSGLRALLKKERSIFFSKYEDVHSAVEMELVKLIGDTGKKLHAGRSRNDLVATDTRLFVKEEAGRIGQYIKKLMRALVTLAEDNRGSYMPGYTHLQQAQVIGVSQWFLAYFWMFKRDAELFKFVRSRADRMPLGSGALAGSNYAIDRNLTAAELKFGSVCENSVDAVSDRDFMLDFLYACSVTAMHLSRLAEEITIYNSAEFKFIEIDDSFATGSSIMPQKKNPDIAELLRGKTGGFYGSLMAGLSMMKGLPLAYNKDLQEDKVLIFRACDEIKPMLSIAEKLMRNITFRTAAGKAAKSSFLYAVDFADYLVTKKKLSFREAHEITGKLVAYCVENGKDLGELSGNEAKKVSKHFDDAVFALLKPSRSAEMKKTSGSTSPASIEEQISAAGHYLKDEA